MSTARPLLTDICWTLYRSNTTFDFLNHVIQEKGYLRLRRWMKNPWIRRVNLLILKLTHRDLARARALKYMECFSPEQIEQMADDFVRTELEEKRIEQAWQMLDGREVVLVSGTIRPIAEAVGRRIGATKVYSNDIFKRQALQDCEDYDILTDNLSDKALVQKAQHAYIVAYGNQDKWLELGLTNIEFIANESDRY